MITPEIARQALNKMTDMIADDNYFTVDAALTVWEEQTERVESQIDLVKALEEKVSQQAKEIDKAQEEIKFQVDRNDKQRKLYFEIETLLFAANKEIDKLKNGLSNATFLLDQYEMRQGDFQAKQLELAVKALKEISEAQLNKSMYASPLDAAMIFRDKARTALSSINSLGGRDTP